METVDKQALEIQRFWNVQPGRISTVRNKLDDINYLLARLSSLEAERDEWKRAAHENHAELNKVSALFGAEIEKCTQAEKERDIAATALNEINGIVLNYEYEPYDSIRTIIESVKSENSTNE